MMDALETTFRDRVTCRFDGDRIALDRSVNVKIGPQSRPTITGTMA
jgi:hypothetical protein